MTNPIILRWAVVACLCVAPGPVAAQTRGAAPPPTSNILRFGGTAGDYQRRLTTEILMRDRSGDGPASPSDDLLIDRIAPLVAEGRCAEARARAREAGDRALSRRIASVCIEGRVVEPAPAR